MKKKLFPFIAIFFSVIGIFLLINSNDKKTSLLGIINILFFGGGGIIYLILNNNKVGLRIKKIALLFGCLIFIITSYFLLPIHHLFDDNKKYHPTIGWIIGIIGMLFFGYGFIITLIKFLKNDGK